MDKELTKVLLEELQRKTENEEKLIIALCGVVKRILTAITIISIVVAVSYFWSPQSYDEYNQDSKNYSVEGGEIDG